MTTLISPRRAGALSRAESTLFLRNPTIMVMALFMPASMALIMYGIYDSQAGTEPRLAAGFASELFVLAALMFVQFYSVLSAITARRDEGVLKRLRTGEATDAEILSAVAVPGALITIVSALVVTVVLSGFAGGTPTDVLRLVLAVGFGLALSTAFAFVTSIYTRSVESAQVTSLPVMGMAMLSQSGIREMMPERVRELVDRTPFAVISDFSLSSWTTEPVGTGAVQGVLILLVWTLALGYWAYSSMRWDSHR